MQPSTRSRAGGYSDFFSSGFRAIASKNATDGRSRPSSTYSLPSFQSSLARSRSGSPRNSADGGDRGGKVGGEKEVGAARRTHQPHKSESSLPSSDKRKRRSSFIQFSTKLFDKITPGISEAESFVQFDDTKKRLRPAPLNMNRSHLRTTHLANLPKTGTYHESNEIDPFNSSPDSKSFFIDLSDSSSNSSSSPRSPSRVPAARPRPQSYISFSGSSLSSLTSFTRRERPASIHSLPAARRSPHSSSNSNSPRASSRTSSHHHRLSAVVTIDSAFQEESAAVIEDRDLSNIDWRDFHVQLF